LNPLLLEKPSRKNRVLTRRKIFTDRWNKRHEHQIIVERSGEEIMLLEKRRDIQI
jgi:hypothetical protein